MLQPVRREKKCRACPTRFVPSRPLQVACCPDCAQTLAERKREKQAQQEEARRRKEARQRLDAVKSRADWLKEAQTAVNRYVRLRDRDKGCISCDRPATWDGQWHASHFRSVGAASAVRFNLWNIHKACSVCNHHLSGNLAAYRPRLVALIGQKRVDWLDSQNQVVRHDIEYLKKIKRVFSKRANRIARMLK
jgi:hypothetical protein